MKHIDQLAELLRHYTIEEIAEELDVTTRSIQNYMAKTNPTTPYKETVRKLHEIYAKHEKEGAIKTPGTDQGYKEKYFAQLERTSKIEEEIKEVKTNLEQLSIDATSLTARILKGQEDIKTELLQALHTIYSTAALPGGKPPHKHSSRTGGK